MNDRRALRRTGWPTRGCCRPRYARRQTRKTLGGTSGPRMPYFICPRAGPRDEQRALRVEEHAPYVLCHHMSQAGDLAMSSGHCVSRCAHLCHISASRDLAMSNEPLAPIEERLPYALLTSSMCWTRQAPNKSIGDSDC